MNLPNFLNIRRIPFIMEPPEHVPKVLDHSHHGRTQEGKRSRNILPSLLLEDLRKLVKGQLIARQRDRPTLVVSRIQKDLRRDRADITAPDHLQRLPLQRGLETRRKDLAHEVGCEVIVEGGRAQDGPIHLAVFGLFDEMLLDMMFVDEVGDVGGVVEGLCAVAVDGGVDEVLDAVFESFVDEVFALEVFGGFVSDCGLAHISIL